MEEVHDRNIKFQKYNNRCNGRCDGLFIPKVLFTRDQF